MGPHCACKGSCGEPEQVSAFYSKPHRVLRYLELGTNAGWLLLLMEMEKGFCNAVVQC